MLQTIVNAWKIADLRKKIIFTALIVLVFRIGSAIPVPFTDIGESGIISDPNAGTFMNYLAMMTGDAFTYGTHGSTFGGNPICCAAAINVLSRIDENLLSEVRAKSEYIKSELSSCKGVRSVNGMGLMIGIDCEKNAKDVILKCIERGVLVISAKSKVRLLPSLNIPTEDLKKAITILKEVISE